MADGPTLEQHCRDRYGVEISKLRDVSPDALERSRAQERALLNLAGIPDRALSLAADLEACLSTLEDDGWVPYGEPAQRQLRAAARSLVEAVKAIEQATERVATERRFRLRPESKGAKKRPDIWLGLAVDEIVRAGLFVHDTRTGRLTVPWQDVRRVLVYLGHELSPRFTEDDVRHARERYLRQTGQEHKHPK